MSLSIHVIDDDEQVRESLGLLLETVGHTVLTFASGEAYIEADAALTDAVLILDVRMPGRDGLDVLDHVRQRSASVPVIMISGHGDIPLAVKAMQSGANDFVEKPFVANRILNAIDKAGAPADQTVPESEDRLAVLTPREREVAERLAEGKPNKIVAHELGVSVRTVETHRARLKSKLSIGSLAELVRIVLESEN
ncbi:response regulator transcription factor [Algimonas porphyrae]|uniref:DNA-binding response regulator n=1 Tax=Algimonas porphyrae TaxID=1128113 RepID=A0ABQ5V3K4_9PROT|nr:response regulator [Algimonas porphyrae]GLQ21627.1 DNA-binding response regulator [Algimonas porphyrae]